MVVESLFVFAACLATSPKPDTQVGGMPSPLLCEVKQMLTETVSVFAGFRG